MQDEEIPKDLKEGCKMRRYVRFFRELGRDDFPIAGGKAANLGELTQKGFNVPSGFCVISECLHQLIEYNHLLPRIDSTIQEFDYKDFKGMEEKTGIIRDMITNAEIPDEMFQEIRNAVKELNEPEAAFVAIRSSVAVKDSEISSFPGMMDTYHYLKGEKDIFENIRKCWASLWTSRAVFLRHSKNIDHHKGIIAPIVQKMVHSEVAGVLFTANPITSRRDEMVIEANWGLGESVVSGQYVNDFYLVDKGSITIKEKRIGKKDACIAFDRERGCGRIEIKISPEKHYSSTLSNEQVGNLGKVAIQIEETFCYPQDIEWAYEEGELFILQSRKIRNLKD